MDKVARRLSFTQKGCTYDVRGGDDEHRRFQSHPKEPVEKWREDEGFREHIKVDETVSVVGINEDEGDVGIFGAANRHVDTAVNLVTDGGGNFADSKNEAGSEVASVPWHCEVGKLMSDGE